MMQRKNGSIKNEVKRLLEIKGNKANSKSVFDRLQLPRNLEVDTFLAEDNLLNVSTPMTRLTTEELDEQLEQNHQLKVNG